MKLERQLSDLFPAAGPFVPPARTGTGPAEDDLIRELRGIWPSPVDLAKRPGTLYRLHAILNG